MLITTSIATLELETRSAPKRQPASIALAVPARLPLRVRILQELEILEYGHSLGGEFFERDGSVYAR